MLSYLTENPINQSIHLAKMNLSLLSRKVQYLIIKNCLHLSWHHAYFNFVLFTIFVVVDRNVTTSVCEWKGDDRASRVWIFRSLFSAVVICRRAMFDVSCQRYIRICAISSCILCGDQKSLSRGNAIFVSIVVSHSV